MEKRSIYITGTQAIRLHRMARMDEGVELVAAPAARLMPLCPDVRTPQQLEAPELMELLGAGAARPLELLVPNDDSRRWSRGIKTSVVSVPLPSGAFLELGPGCRRNGNQIVPNGLRVFVESPAMSIMGAARTLLSRVARGDMSRLAATFRVMAFADEYCGFYSRHAVRPYEERIHYDEPGTDSRLTNPVELQGFLAELHDVDGALLARLAVRHAIDGSGSPMETCLNHALTLPPRLAGLSMGKPLANKQLVADERIWKVLHHGQSLRPDLQWPDEHTLAEYLGGEEHAGKPARIEDKNRMQDYATAGYAAFPLMYDDVKDQEALARTAQMIARERMRRGASCELYRVWRLLRDPGFVARQRVLMATLLPPVMRYGDG